MRIRAIVFALMLAGVTHAQDAPPERGAPGGESDLAKELVERIRKSLGEVNEALLDAADADAEMVKGEFDRALISHRKAIRDIEELINQIKYQQSTSSSSSGGGQQQQQQQSPSQSESEARESDGQNAPQPNQSSGSQQQDQQAQGSESGQQDQQTQDGSSSNEEQRDGLSDADGSQQDANGPPPEDPTAPFSRTDTDGRWGLLPPKLQERLMNLHVNDVPSRYRRHLDAYIRALNAQADGDR